MGGDTRSLTKSAVLTVSTVLIIAMVLTATNVQALATASSTTLNDDPWAERATKALGRAEHVISYAMDKIVEQAEGTDGSLAKNVLKASIKIYGSAKEAFGENRYKKAFLMAVLSALVARDSARVAVEGPGAIDLIMGEVAGKLAEAEAFIDGLEGSADVTLACVVLERSEEVYAKAEEKLANERLVRAVVAAEMSRMLAHVAEMIAQRGQ